MGVCFDILAGTLTIGGRAIPARLMPDGGLALGDDAGLVLRPLRFAERAAAVAIGSATKDTERGVAAAVSAFAVVGAQAGDSAIAEIAALHLCGADAVDLPSFAATALLLGRAAGWSLSDIGEALATEVDRLVRTLAPPPADDGWTRVRFVDGGGHAAVDGLDRVLRGLARNLLDRNDANAADSVAGSTGAKLADAGSRAMVLAPMTEAAATQNAAIQSAAARVAAARKRADLPDVAVRDRTPALGDMRDDRANGARDAAGLGSCGPHAAALSAMPDAGPMARGDGAAGGDIASSRNQAGPMPADHPAKLGDWSRDAAATAPVPLPGPASLVASPRDAMPHGAGSGAIVATASSQRGADPERRFRLPIRATSASPNRQAANDMAAVAPADGARPTASGASAALAATPAWDPDAFPKDAGADWAWAADSIAGAPWTGQSVSTLVPQAPPDTTRTDAARDWDTDTLIESIAERLHDTADLRGIDR